MIPKYPTNNFSVLDYKENLHKVYEYWVDKIPFFELPIGWKISVIPPFHDAIVRFRIMRNDKKSFSIYLDCYEKLGYFSNKPYWEVYPIGEDVERFNIDEIDQLIECIKNEK